MTDQPVPRPLTPDELPALARMLDAVFPDSIKSDPAVLRWQYLDNPYGAASSLGIVTDGAVRAHFAAIPVEVVRWGEVVSAALSADAATAVDARGRGWFTTVARATLAHAAARGLPFTVTKPNDSSRRGLEGVGMQLVGQVPTWLLPVDPDALGDLVALPRPVRGAMVGVGGARRLRAAAAGAGMQVDELDPELMAARWRSERVAGDNGLHRDVRWWAWRYERPGAGYDRCVVRRNGDVAAAVVTLKRRTREGLVRYVLDAVGRDPDALRAALWNSVDGDEAVVLGIGWPGTAGGRRLRAMGLRRLPDRLNPRPSWFGVIPNTPDAGDVATGRWDVAWCDYDHV